MLKTVKRLLSYLKYHKASFFMGIGLLMLTTLMGLYSPMVIKTIIDQVITPAGQGDGLQAGLLFQLLAFYLFLNLASSLTSIYGRYTLKKVSNRIVKDLRDQVFAHVQKLPIQYFDSLPAGKVVSRITNDTEVLRSQFYESTISTIFNSIILIIGTYTALFLLNPSLTTGLLLIVPVVLVWQILYSRYASRYTKALREWVSDLNGKLNETIQGMSIVQAFQQESRIYKEFKAASQSWQKVGSKFLLLDATLSWGLSGFFRNATMLAVVVYVGTQFLGGTFGLTAGVLYAFIDYINRLFDPIDAFVQVMSSFQQAIAAGGRVFELLDTPIEESPDQEMVMTQGEVVFDQVKFAYKDDNYVLNDINFTAQAGQTVAFVGHTGSGKSSIMNLLFRFYDPNQGTISIDGQNTKDYSRKSVRKDMAIVLQDPYLFKGTIASNVSMNNPSISDAEIEEALIRVGAKHLIERSDKGIHFAVREKGADFSSGERQLISFARALVYNPKIMILDEATSHVDTETEETIQHAMSVLEEGRTTFIIAHRLSTILNADQIIVLDKGRIIERGNHQSLLDLDGVYAEMYRMQAKSMEV
ncbi:ABC transporter ATP-binding protein [Granulicatella seriolae]|uniref:ABC transporter ATP-binding protein/permease n=1 Tax=Granulicatella seriolae TaxID=2967226 RepID=A0ABT1WPC2_9LACT|nr:ABC transporter ATP-binding protein [Granulicatella seriolae]